MNKQNTTTTIVRTIRELPLRIVRNGMLLAIGFFGTTILAVAISGTIKTWTTGEVLKSADLNTTIASLKTAIEGITSSQWTTNGANISYTAGNVGIGTASPTQQLSIIGSGAGKILLTNNSNATNMSTELQLGNDLGDNRFRIMVGGSGYTYNAQWADALTFYTAQTKDINFVTSDTTRMTVKGSGYVGIGTTSPTQTLHLHNGIQPVLKLTSTSGDFQMGVNNTDTWVASVGSNPLEISVGGSERMRITSTGLVGIGRIPTTHPLEVQGTAGLTSGTAWTNISDERLKDIDGTISSALDNLLKLNPIKYKYNEASGKLFKNADGKSKYGFTAQNVKSVFPEMVITDDKGYLWYNPSGFEAILTSAIKEVAFRLRSTSDSVSVVTQKIEFLEKEKAANEKKLLALEESNQKLIEDNKKLREMVETHGRASLRLEDRLRAIENTQMARK
ncbi:MAG: tail fiber domain-containing protein [Leptospiraceae bacterium]|nr:tail fiber domain-containing protein [Leptospiraceae bacterium]